VEDDLDDFSNLYLKVFSDKLGNRCAKVLAVFGVELPPSRRPYSHRQDLPKFKPVPPPNRNWNLNPISNLNLSKKLLSSLNRHTETTPLPKKDEKTLNNPFQPISGHFQPSPETTPNPETKKQSETQTEKSLGGGEI